jgi:ATP-dependent DNA helicase RecG
MTKTELLELIRNGESSGVEFKRDTLENRALAKELVAFANFQGGQVLLGVEDDGTIAGTTRANLEEWVMTACRDKIRPEIIPYYEHIADVEPGKDVAIVRVEPGWTVHHLWHDQHRTYYIRIGTVSREASREELERLFQHRGAFKVETRPVSGSTLGDLDLRRLRDYFARVRQQEAPRDDDHQAWRTLLANTEIMSADGPEGSATVAGMLLFGSQPNRFLPHAGVDAVAYPGVEKDYEATERAPLRGPMTPLMNAAGELVENGLVEQALDFCRRNLAVGAVLEDGARRREEWPYPLDAIREVIVNALVHRDYLLSATDIELSIYANRFETISPGRLPNGITPTRMRAGCRASRNQLLKDVMRDYGYLEHMGMGVPRKIVRLVVDQNGRQPDLEENEESFLVRLWKRPDA